ncbi:hypothetical protein JKP88DRAFT_242793 [Tribonema minus]|uniref:Uncharacterized protein n=1 Tax=Tribonema minus TaxID=303371 RepID=A0A835ZFH8_9STRA|nr:hypothetical protein JKP88DRAFT_242793 [Tribonema minus]
MFERLVAMMDQACCGIVVTDDEVDEDKTAPATPPPKAASAHPSDKALSSASRHSTRRHSASSRKSRKGRSSRERQPNAALEQVGKLAARRQQESPRAKPETERPPPLHLGESVRPATQSPGGSSVGTTLLEQGTLTYLSDASPSLDGLPGSGSDGGRSPHARTRGSSLSSDTCIASIASSTHTAHSPGSLSGSMSPSLGMTSLPSPTAAQLGQGGSGSGGSSAQADDPSTWPDAMLEAYLHATLVDGGGLQMIRYGRSGRGRGILLRYDGQVSTAVALGDITCLKLRLQKVLSVQDLRRAWSLSGPQVIRCGRSSRRHGILRRYDGQANTLVWTSKHAFRKGEDRLPMRSVKKITREGSVITLATARSRMSGGAASTRLETRKERDAQILAAIFNMIVAKSGSGGGGGGAAALSASMAGAAP